MLVVLLLKQSFQKRKLNKRKMFLKHVQKPMMHGYADGGPNLVPESGTIRVRVGYALGTSPRRFPKVGTSSNCGYVDGLHRVRIGYVILQMGRTQTIYTLFFSKSITWAES